MKFNREELILLRTGQKQAQRSGDYWSKDDLDRLNQMFADGCGFSEIAMTLDRNEVSIYQQLSKSGLLAAQCKSRSRRVKQIDRPQCLCPDCAVADCRNCGKECAHAGTLR